LQSDASAALELVGIVSAVRTSSICTNAVAEITDIGFYREWILSTAKSRFNIEL
jgi:hypothetical protein